MRRLAEICIHRPIFAMILIMALVVVGATAWLRLPTDRFPSVDLPTVRIDTRLPGAAPETIETDVTRIIEEAVNSVEGIEELRSISGTGQSVVIVTFRLDRSIDAATQDVRDRVLASVRKLPDDTELPIVSKLDNDTTPVLTLAISGPRSLRELTELTDKVIKTQLERTQGVGEVSIVGGQSRSINVWVKPDQLAALRLPITAVRDAITRENSEIPGGNLTGANYEERLRTMGRVNNPADFGDFVVATVQQRRITLNDVATVEDGTVEMRSAARLDGQPAVSLDIRRQSGANTMAVITSAKAELDKVRGLLPPDVRVEIIKDQSRYINAALHEIETHLVLGALLACLVVLVFMRNARATLIAGVAIPTSVIATFGLMWALDFTLNSVTMLALVLMVGIVIDDAIVVLENIYRMVEEKHLTPFQAAKEGTSEIALAVLATTLSLVVIFIPVSFMSSISGRFLYQFGLTAAAAVMVSLLVSFTLTPMLSARALAKKKPSAGPTHDPSVPVAKTGINHWLDLGYVWLLKICLRWRWAVAVLALVIIATTWPLYHTVQQDYLPAGVDEGEFQVNVNAPEGTSFTAMNDLMQQIETDLRGMPQVRTILANAGGGFLGATNSGNIYVGLHPHATRYFGFSRFFGGLLKGDFTAAFKGNYTQSEAMAAARKKLAGYPQLRLRITPYAAFNIGGGSWDIDLAIRGPDLPQLVQYAEALRLRSPELGGILDADISVRLNNPEVQVIIDRSRARDLQVQPEDIGTALRLLVGGTDVSRFRDPDMNENYDVIVRLEPTARTSSESLPTMLLPSAAPGVGLVELRSIAEASRTYAATRIDRLNRQRVVSLRAGVAPGFALADRLAVLKQAAQELNMSSGYSVTVSGRGRELERTFTEFGWAFLLSMIFMYMILAAQFESLVHPFTILLSLPLSVPFALLSLWLTGSTLNLYSALGLLVLFGVVKKNAILQIDHMNQLRARGMPRWEAVLQGNRDRLRPILMTTLALVGGMLPLALGNGPGAEERRAVAIVVIGGQTLSLVLTLVVTPVFYWLLEDLGTRLGIAKPPHMPGEPLPGELV